MGHFLTARRHGVRVTWPYFLPGPPLASLGTFGAFIRLKGAIPERGALMEIGANGPLWGFLASLAVGAAAFASRAAGYIAPLDLGVNVRLPLAMWALRGVFTGKWGHTVTLFDNPLVLAAWIGFFIQGLNLLPVGQLDGGHVLYAFARGGHRFWSAVIALGFLGFALFHPEWLLWVVLIFFVLGLRHPPCMDDDRPLSPRQVLLGLAAAAIFAVSFVPLPFVWTD
jgi:membrane-associated protease RseP (regulator of RpoE activity)